MIDWSLLRDDWDEVREAVQAFWPRLTRDDLQLVSGSRVYLIDMLCHRYAQPEDAMRHAVDERLPGLWADCVMPRAA